MIDYRFQSEAADVLKHMLGTYNGAILRADEGIGKTYIAGRMLQYMPELKKVLWVGQAGPLPKIKKSLAEFEDVYNKITFISYDAFGDGHSFSPYDLIIFDEAHELRNYSAAKTQRLVRARRKKALFMTGTPIVKHAKDLSYIILHTGVFKMSSELYYVKYFGATKSRFGDFLEKRELTNEVEWKNMLKKVWYDLSYEDIDVDMAPMKFHFIKLPGTYKLSTQLQEYTKDRVSNGVQKAHEAVQHLTINGKALILCKYHKTAKLLEKLTGFIYAGNSDRLCSLFNCPDNDTPIITTLGLTRGGLDYQQCDRVYLVESSHSWAMDRQSIRRCYRLGKKNQLDVTYFYFEDEAPFIKSMNSMNLVNLKEPQHSKIGPSALAGLEKCPGAFWLDDTSTTMYHGHAYQGKVEHAMLEEYINDPSLPLSRDFTCYKAANYCRQLAKGAASWGCEDRVRAPSIHKDFWGTVDFWAYSHVDKCLHVVDYKNGNSAVAVKNNLQLIAYALALVESKDIKPESVKMTIYQKDTYPKMYTVPTKKLDKQRIIDIINKVDLAKDNPRKYLNPKCYSPFCRAYLYHKRERERNKKEDK